MRKNVIIVLIIAICLFLPYLKVDAYSSETEVVTAIDTIYDREYNFLLEINNYVTTYKNDLEDSFDFDSVTALNSYDLETLIDKTVELLAAKNHTEAKDALLALKPDILTEYNYLKDEYAGIKAYIDSRPNKKITDVDDILYHIKVKTPAVKTELKKIYEAYYDILEAKVKEKIESNDFTPGEYEPISDKVFNNFVSNNDLKNEIITLQGYYNDYHLEDFGDYISDILGDDLDYINTKYASLLAYVKNQTKAKVQERIDTYKVDLDENDPEQVANYNNKVLALIDRADYYENYYNSKKSVVNDYIKIDLLKEKVTAKENEITDNFDKLRNYIRTFLIEKSFIELVNEDDSSFIKIDHKNYIITYYKTDLDSTNFVSKLKVTTGTLIINDFNGKIGTTSTIVNKISDNVSVTYTIVVKGDVAFDGKFDITDVVNIADHMFDKSKLTGFKLMAADINDDNKIDITDIVMTCDKLFGKGE